MKMLHREVISIEETSSFHHIRPNSCIRRFTLTNHLTNFQIIIKNVGGTLISCCKLSDDLVKNDELIRQDNNDENQQINQQTSSGSVKRNQNNPISINQTNEFEWQSHVLGANSISFSTNSHHNSTITWQLNMDNSLLMLGKLRSSNHLSYLDPFYFNLNSSSTSVDGHFLHIKANKSAKFDQSPENSLSFSLIGSDDNEFLSFLKSPARISWSSNAQDNKKVYELIYKLNGRYKEASIICILSYGSKRIEVTLQNSLNNLSSSNQISTNLSQQSTAITSNQLTNTQNHCKFKIIICSVGVAILPNDLNEFKCSYKFYI